MTSSARLTELDSLTPDQREHFALQQVIDGFAVQWPRVAIPCSGRGDTFFFVAGDYFALGSGNAGDFIRIPLSGPMAQRMVDTRGTLLPTKHMVDLIHAWAVKYGCVSSMRLALGPPYDASMRSFARLLQHEQMIEADMARQQQQVRPQAQPLFSGIKKDVLQAAALMRDKSRLAFYGMIVNGKPVQPFNTTAHAAEYDDYSHGVREVDPVMLVDGKRRLVLEVLADPTLCHLLSHEGPLVGARYAGQGNMTNIPATIKQGSKGADVAKWQAVVGVATIDGDFGPKTHAATMAWQLRRGLKSDGVVGPKTWAAWLSSAEAPTQPLPPTSITPPPPFAAFKQAKHYAAKGMREVRLVVIHTMEWGETVNTAEACATFFTNPIGPKGPVTASAHYCVDSDSIVQCVRETDAAWHTPGFIRGVEVNRQSIGVEHAGFASQTPAQWGDAYSMQMLKLSARLVASICAEHGIPVRHLTREEIIAGEKGIVGHADCSKAVGGSHTDPGASFPWAAYLAMVSGAIK